MADVLNKLVMLVHQPHIVCKLDRVLRILMLPRKVDILLPEIILQALLSRVADP